MKGSKKVIAALNEILTGELTAINQYVLHSSICKNWGYKTLAKEMYAESIDEMKHAQIIIDRVLFLEGLPNLQKLFPLNIGETVIEQIKSDHQLEVNAIARLRNAITVCEEEEDTGSTMILEDILKSEEEHLEHLEGQITLYNQVGEQHFLAKQI